MRVRLYDIDPNTLSPDLDSVARVLAEGASTIVVAHLYGYPADVPGVAALAAMHGASVIEDAAQGAWGSISGTRLGAFGPHTVLSFGRGKGMTGGGGGALLGIGAPPAGTADFAHGPLARARSGARTLATTAAQWALGRPAMYALPSAIPALHLGETIYHAAHEPRAITAVSASLVRASLARADADLAVRTRNAERLARGGERARGVRVVHAIDGGRAGYLRYPLRVDDARGLRAELGIVRGYPDTLAELEELRASLVGDEMLTGARELRRTLVTLPTHAMVKEKDLRELTDWLG